MMNMKFNSAENAVHLLPPPPTTMRFNRSSYPSKQFIKRWKRRMQKIEISRKKTKIQFRRSKCLDFKFKIEDYGLRISNKFSFFLMEIDQQHLMRSSWKMRLRLNLCRLIIFDWKKNNIFFGWELLLCALSNYWKKFHFFFCFKTINKITLLYSVI